MTRPTDPQTSLDARLVAELPDLRAFVRRLAGGGATSADVEDFVQDVVARALRYRDAFDAQRALGPWLRTTALRVFIDHRERGAKAPRALDAQDDELVAREVVSGERLERREELTAMLEHLDATEREALVRFHGRGQSVREIAAALGLPEGTVKSHLHRARRKLARFKSNEDGQ
jgi:RNA polymerase sigma-70 factor (ECF subfamily)